MKKALGIDVVGMGAVTACGVGLQPLCAAVGKTQTQSRSRNIENLDVERYVTLRTKCLDKTSALSLVATSMVLDEAGWKTRGGDRTRIGLVLATMSGNTSVVRAYHREEPSPLRFLHTFTNAPAGLICQAFELRGAHANLCSGPSSGLQAIRYACHLLNSHKADQMICGGVDRLAPDEDPLPLFYRNDALPYGEGAGFLGLQRAGEPIQGKYHGAIASMGSAPVNGEARGFEEAMRYALEVKDQAIGGVDAIVLATHTMHPDADTERNTLLRIGIAQEKWLEIHEVIGNVGAAQAVLATMIGLVSRGNAPDERPRNVLVNTMENNRCVSILLRSVQ